MRPNPDSAPTVAKPMPNLDPRMTRRPEADASRPIGPNPKGERADSRLPESKPADYDDFSWM
jgi:hypothetical protein